VWREAKAPKCLRISSLRGVQVTRDDSIDLLTEERQRLRARLDENCRTLDFYSGFYVERTADGMICADRDVAFIVNDSVTLAKRLGADGVHLGRSDGDIREARAELGPSVQIGATCHDSRHFAMEAGEAGVDYVAFGAFYETQTKPSEYRPEPEILTWWSRIFELPCVAIGGITPANAPPLIAAGADFVAVCGAVWNGDEAKAVGDFTAMFAKSAE